MQACFHHCVATCQISRMYRFKVSDVANVEAEWQLLEASKGAVIGSCDLFDVGACRLNVGLFRAKFSFFFLVTGCRRNPASVTALESGRVSLLMDSSCKSNCKVKLGSQMGNDLSFRSCLEMVLYECSQMFYVWTRKKLYQHRPQIA